METEGLISIIIPIYNCEQYLEECLESVVNQTYQNIEIILVNDGSSDSSEHICLRYCERDNRIVYVAQENKGVSAARNKGLQLAKGKYCMFVDADDMIDKDICQIAYNEMPECDILFCATVSFKGKLEISNKNNGTQAINLCEFEAVDWVKAALGNTQQIAGFRLALSPVWGKLYRKEFLCEKGVSFPLDIPVGEDLLFNLKLYARRPRVYYLPVVSYYYRYNEESVVHKYTPEYDKRNCALLSEMEMVLKEYELWEETRNEIAYQKRYGLIRALSSDIFHPNNPKEESRKRRDFRELVNRECYRNMKTTVKLSVKYRVIYLLAQSGQYDLLKILFKLNHINSFLLRSRNNIKGYTNG